MSILVYCHVILTLSIIGVQDKPSDHESCYCQEEGNEKEKWH